MALAVAVLALFAVVSTLVGLGHTTRDLREEIIQVLEPARTQLYELQRLLALQEAELRGGAPPPVLVGSLPERTALERGQEEALARLRVLSHRAGPAAVEAFAELRAYSARWRARLEENAGTPASASSREGTQAEYAEVLGAADRLHRVLTLEVAERRERLDALERLEVALIVGMVLLALLAILVMWRIGRQQTALVEQARRLAEESEQRRRALERVSREKEQFIRGITHDLKNPLGAIDAYAQLLEAELRGSLSEEDRRYVGRIRNAAQQTFEIIQDLLELARAEASGVRIETREVDLLGLVHGVAEDYRAALENAGHVLSVETSGSPPRIETDERRVRDILGNLLSNVVKYTSAGGRVWMRVLAPSSGPEVPDDSVLVQVQDTGPGIPADAHETIFEEFQRLHEGSAAGAGVGLSISRRMARLMGGDLTVESRVGEGATFTLRLPLRSGGPEAVPLPEA